MYIQFPGEKLPGSPGSPETGLAVVLIDHQERYYVATGARLNNDSDLEQYLFQQENLVRKTLIGTIVEHGGLSPELMTPQMQKKVQAFESFPFSSLDAKNPTTRRARAEAVTKSLIKITPISIDIDFEPRVIEGLKAIMDSSMIVAAQSFVFRHVPGRMLNGYFKSYVEPDSKIDTYKR